MKKFYKFLKSFLFISLWLILSSFLTQNWNTFHWEYVYFNFRIIFDIYFWFVVEKILLGFDIGYLLTLNLEISAMIKADFWKIFKT